jgi:hypothetical protein
VSKRTGCDPSAVYEHPDAAPWRDADLAELSLRRFLRHFDV